jgi:hypothetical protein
MMKAKLISWCTRLKAYVISELDHEFCELDAGAEDLVLKKFSVYPGYVLA